MLKFELNDTVYFLKNNKICKGKVIARKFSDRIDNFNIYADGPNNEWINNATGGAFTSYYIVHSDNENHWIDQNDVFKNDAELIESLYSKD